MAWELVEVFVELLIINFVKLQYSTFHFKVVPKIGRN